MSNKVTQSDFVETLGLGPQELTSISSQTNPSRSETILEGIGIQTIAALAATIGVGELTPLDCYVGLGASTGSAVELEQPMGALGCEYDFGNVRLFVEHLSSPADGGDYPGMNHAGVKVLFPVQPITAYAGLSYEFGSHLVHMDSPLFIVGAETNGDIRLYVEHINSVTNPNEGITHGGIKFFF
jgi:hypothetical protein